MFIYGYNKVATNLIYADNNRQLDCIFGRLSGIAEMFLQSEAGEVSLLPALPSKLATNGMVSGLCARGGFEVDDLTWTNGRLTGASILSRVGNVCRLRSKWPVDVMLGSNYVDAPMVLPGLYQFSTQAGSNYTIVPARVFETENLLATTNGATQQCVTNAAYSNCRGMLFNAAAKNVSVTYTVSNLPAGNYHLRVGADAGANRGKFQLACALGIGTSTNIGTVQDTYSPTNVAYLLPLHLTTPTNVISLWTNMLQEMDCGTWQASSNGNYNFTFTVTDKNAGSSGYALVLDYLKFTPVISAPSNNPPLTPTNIAPAPVALNQSLTPALQASTFISSSPGATQTASEWLIQRLSDHAMILDSGTDTLHATSIVVPSGLLDYGESYSWQTQVT